MKVLKQMALAVMVYFMTLLIVSFIIRKNLFIIEWEDILICFVFYTGVVLLVLQLRKNASN
jgi:hypothetical protein